MWVSQAHLTKTTGITYVLVCPMCPCLWTNPPPLGCHTLIHQNAFLSSAPKPILSPGKAGQMETMQTKAPETEKR
jgi:hypothetical protein